MVIVITGPIASGKSTIARELARELERTHGRVAVIDLDQVYDMLRPDGTKSDGDAWSLARRAAATLVNAFLKDGVAVVVAEGSFNTPDDRAAFARHLDPSIEPLYVTLRVSFEEALRRAQGDPTRGMSRDPVVLGGYFAAADHAHATIPKTDVMFDTEQTTSTSAASAIASLVRQGR